MSFNVGDIVVPSSDRHAEVVGVPAGTRLRVTSDYGHGDTTVESEDGNTNYGGWNTSRFILATSDFINSPVGTRFIVTATDLDYHGFAAGTVVTVVEMSSSLRSDRDRYNPDCIRVSGTAEWGTDTIEQWVNAHHVSAAPAEAETLESFKVSFLTGAIARGVANGATHAQQVEKALERLAGLEYLDPSKTLEDFQKRVVALAMEKKAEHSWCGEPEAYLTEIGLGHLLPVRKYLTVTLEVEVSGEATWSRRQWREAASEAAKTSLNNGVTVSLPRNTSISNDLPV
jgi:hypothetical protein